MDLQKAEQLIGQAVENPAAKVSAEDLSLAVATVLLRSGLMGLSLSKATVTVVTAEGGDADA